MISRLHHVTVSCVLPLGRLLLLAGLCLVVAGCASTRPQEQARERTRAGAEADAAPGRLRPVHDRFWMEIVSPTGAALHLYASWPFPDAGEMPSGRETNALLIRDDGTFEVPPGEYRISRWVLEEVGRAGTKWRCESHDSEASRPVTVRSGETTDLTFGPPLRAELTQTSNPSASLVSFSLTLRGRGGIIIRSITRDGRPAEEPLIRVVNEAGIQVVTYG